MFSSSGITAWIRILLYRLFFLEVLVCGKAILVNMVLGQPQDTRYRCWFRRGLNLAQTSSVQPELLNVLLTYSELTYF